MSTLRVVLGFRVMALSAPLAQFDWLFFIHRFRVVVAAGARWALCAVASSGMVAAAWGCNGRLWFNAVCMCMCLGVVSACVRLLCGGDVAPLLFLIMPPEHRCSRWPQT